MKSNENTLVISTKLATWQDYLAFRILIYYLIALFLTLLLDRLIV